MNLFIDEGLSTAAGILDAYSAGIWAGYGLVRQNSSYTGPCMRVRVGSSSAQMDIPYLSNGQIDAAAATAFAATGSGGLYVVTWYDNWNGNHITNVANGSQPTIDTSISKMVFGSGAGTAAFLLTANSGGTVPTKSVFMKFFNRGASLAAQVVYEYGNGSQIGGGSGNGNIEMDMNESGPRYHHLIAPNGPSAAYSYRDFAPHANSSPTAGATIYARGGYTQLKAYTAAGLLAQTAGADVGGGDGSAVTNYPALPWRLGQRSDGYGAFIDVYSFLIYDADKSANAAAICGVLA